MFYNTLDNLNLVNLFNTTEQTINGVKFTPMGNGFFNIDGTPTAVSIYYICNDNIQTVIKPGQSYVLNIDQDKRANTQLIYTLKNDPSYHVIYSSALKETKDVIFNMPDEFDKFLFRIICEKNESGVIHIDIKNNYKKIENALDTTYATIYTEEEDALINKVVDAKDGSILTFTVTTDPHCTESNPRLMDISRVGARLSEKVGADFRVDLGDIFADVDDTRINARLLNKYITKCKNSRVPFVYSQGNHETFGGHQGESGETHRALEQSQVSALGLTGEDLRCIRNDSDPLGGYYYFDYQSRKVRIYCLNSESNAFSDNQVSWVSNTLEQLPNGYSVLILLHIPPIAEARWNGHATPQNDLAMRNALTTFVNNGGKILAIIHGHMHWDNLFYVNDIKCPVIGITSSVLDNTEIGDSRCSGGNPVRPHRDYDYTQYAIDTFCINTITGNIKIFRFGCGSDREYINQ